MKSKIAYISILLLTGCSILESNKIAPGYVQAYKAITNAISGYENTAITRDLIDKIPYASALIRIGKGPYGLMILESIEDEKEIWVTADGIYFIIEKGRIIETKGLSNNLTFLLMPPALKKLKLNILREEGEFSYYYSYDNPYLVDLKVKAEYEIIGKETVKILNKSMELTLVQENLTNSFIRWKAVNKYWIDADNYVWKSEQTISPKLPSIYIEVTKKPS